MNASPSSTDRPGWRKTVFAVCTSQFITFIGFAAAIPFTPFFIQEELGITDRATVKLYTALFAAATPVTMALMSPVWGALGDRIGRRPMLIRANLGCGIAILLMGFATNIWQLLFLRLLQGAFSGTQVAAQTLATSEAPQHRSGTIIGTLSSVLFAGTLTGSALGGGLAEFFGCRFVFKLAGIVSLLSAILVTLFVRERYGSAAPAQRAVAGAKDSHTCHKKMARRVILAAVPLLLALFGASLARSIDKPMLPLLVENILGRLEGAKAATSILMSLGALAGFAAGIGGGWLADRVRPERLVLTMTLVSAALIFPLGFLGSLMWLYLVFFLASLFSSALEPALQNWLVRGTPETLRGTVIGWTATARATGWTVAPLLSGFFAIHTGLPSVFIVTSVCFLLLCPLAHWAGKKLALR